MLDTLLLTFCAGVLGTLIGALIPVIFKIKSNDIIAILLSFAGGFMLAIVFFDLVPASLEIGNLLFCGIGMIVGITVIMLIDKLLQKPMKKLENSEGGQYKKVGIMLVIAIGLHNLPEGLAIGSLEVIESGLLMTILIMIHNIPEGLAMATPLIKSGNKKITVVGLCAISGLPTVIGGVIGYLIGGIHPAIISISLGIAAGAMIYIVFQEMLPEAYALCKKNDVALYCLFGIILGMVIINLL